MINSSHLWVGLIMNHPHFKDDPARKGGIILKLGEYILGICSVFQLEVNFGLQQEDRWMEFDDYSLT
jgi:hypothetical protein